MPCTRAFGVRIPHKMLLADWVRKLALLVGVLLIFLAVFLYEDEEGRIQYRLERWDKLLLARGAVAHSAVTAFMGGIAELTSRFFDRLFGKGLLSLRVIGVSLCYSIASIFLLAVVAGPFVHLVNKSAVVQYAPLTALFWLLFFVGLGSVPAFLNSEEKESLWLWRLCVFLTVGLPLFQALEFGRTKYGAPQAFRAFLVLGLLLALSFGFDLVFLALIRWMMRCASDAKNPFKTIGIVSLNFLLMLFLLLAFPLVGIALARVHGDPVVVGVFILGFMLNSIDIAAASLFFVLLLVILVHRLTWPLIQRPIHACARYKVITNKKLLWTVGCALILAPKGASLWRLLLQGH